MKHPFILASSAHSLKYLREAGYKTFSPMIDESYDNIEDNEKRILAIVDEVERLSRKTPDEWLEWQAQILHIVEHNYQTFYNNRESIYGKH